MCFFKKKIEPKPDWITQSREEVAEAELEAASIHYTYMMLLEEGNTEYLDMGTAEKHEYWWIKHQEAAWYTTHPEV